MSWTRLLYLFFLETYFDQVDDFARYDDLQLFIYYVIQKMYNKYYPGFKQGLDFIAIARFTH